MGRPKSLRPNDPQLHLAVLSSYKDMRLKNRMINKESEAGEDWKCLSCSCTNYLPPEYGCKECQPYTKNSKLLGRVYG